VIAAAAGRIAGSVFFGGAFGAAVDVEPDVGAVGVDFFLRDFDLVEGVGAGGVAKLPDEGGDLVVGGGFFDDDGETRVGVVEDLERRGRGGGTGWVGCGGDGFGSRCGGRGFAADEEERQEKEQLVEMSNLFFTRVTKVRSMVL
jgi:hypothetical protein